MHISFLFTLDFRGKGETVPLQFLTDIVENAENMNIVRRCAPHQHLTRQENCLNPDIQYQGSIKLLKFFPIDQQRKKKKDNDN